METKNIFIHWLSFTLPQDFTDKELEELCMYLFGFQFSEFEKGYSARNSYFSFYTLNPQDKLITVYRNGIANNRGTTLFEITGLALDTLPSLDLLKIGAYVLEKQGNITRMDLSMDDTGNILPFEEIKESSDKAVYKDRIVSYLNKTVPLYSKQVSESIRFGSSKSSNTITIYRKDELEGVDFPWTRVEARIRNREDTRKIMEALLAGASLGTITAGTIKYYLDFKPAGTKVKGKRPTLQWWVDFTEDIAKRPLGREVKRKNPLIAKQEISRAKVYILNAKTKNPLEIEKIILEMADEIRNERIASNW